MTTKRASLLVTAGISLLCLVMLEVTASFIFEHSKMSAGKRLVLSALKYGGRYTGLRDGYIIAHPYLLYTTRPGYEEFGFVQINSLGYRGREIAREKPAGTYRILCLGSSTTFSYPYIKDPSKTWTGLLESSLNRRYSERRFEVINAGLPYATSAELLAGFMFRHRYLDPDLVIIHEGGNDTSPLMYEDYNPEYSHFRAAGVRILTGRIERTLLHSHVFRVFFMRYWRNVPTIYVPEPYDADKLDRAAALERVKNTYPLGFERNIDLIVQTARQDGADVMLAGFVAQRDELLAKNWPWRKGLEPAMALGIKKNLAVMEALARKYGVTYLSPSEVHFKDEWFVDGCHLTPEGEQVKTDWIFSAVTRTLALP
jgi:hypothetical protein